MPDLKTLLDYVAVLSAVVTASGGLLALVNFRSNRAQRRAEWISSLHAKFYEAGTYKHIRLVLDYQPHPEIDRLEQALAPGGDPKTAEQLVDYLNFFEFVASLWKLKQLDEDEIGMLFEYYIIRLSKIAFVRTFINEEGFENLVALVECLARRKVTRK